MFTGHKYIENRSESTGFKQYLIICCDNTDPEYCCEVYGIDDDAPLDIDAMLAEVYPDASITTTPAIGGSQYAAIITDSRAPDSVIVWDSCDFYLE